MKTNIYILNYKNDYALNFMILKSLFESDVVLEDVEIYIINNHPEINIQDDYLSKVRINNIEFTRYHLPVIRNFKLIVDTKYNCINCEIILLE